MWRAIELEGVHQNGNEFYKTETGELLHTASVGLMLTRKDVIGLALARREFAALFPHLVKGYI